MPAKPRVLHGAPELEASPVRLGAVVQSFLKAQVRQSPIANLILITGLPRRSFASVQLRLEPYAPGFRIISLRAPFTLAPERFAWFHVEFTPYSIHNAAEAEASRQALISFIDELTGRYNVTYQGVVLSSFSRGAILALSVALTTPQKVARVVAMSGRILQEVRERLTPSPGHRHLPILVTHGVHDSKLPIHHARTSRALLESLNIALTYREYPVGHELSEANLRDVGAWLGQRSHTPALSVKGL